MIMTSGARSLTSLTMVLNASSLNSPPTCKSDNCTICILKLGILVQYIHTTYAMNGAEDVSPYNFEIFVILTATTYHF